MYRSIEFTPTAAKAMRIIVFAALLPGIPLFSGAAQQEPSLPTTPRECNSALASLDSAEWRKVADTTLRPRYTNTQRFAATRRYALRCAAQFDPTTVPDGQLLDLVQLYTQAARNGGDVKAQMWVNTEIALDRALANTSVPLAERVKRLVVATKKYTEDSGTLSKAVACVQELDRLPGVSLREQFETHRSLVSAYVDIDGRRALEEIAWIEKKDATLDSATRADVRQWTSLTGVKAHAYESLDQRDSAKAVLEAQIAKLSKIISPSAQEKNQRKNYQRRLGLLSLIGTKATPIVAQHWLNTVPGTQRYVPEGRVSLVMMTAHWCGPCKASYPSVARIADEYRPKGLETIVVLENYGFFGDREDITAAEELKENKKLYVDEFKFHMPIAMYEREIHNGRYWEAEASPTAERYFLDVLPTFYIIGSDGIVQDIIEGWNGERDKAKLTAAINRALGTEGIGKS